MMNEMEIGLGDWVGGVRNDRCGAAAVCLHAVNGDAGRTKF